MRKIKTFTGAFAVVLVTSLSLGLASGNSAAATGADNSGHSAAPSGSTSGPTETSSSETTKERGYVIECIGTYQGQDVWVSLYENSVFTNVIQVVVGDNGTGASRQVKKGFVDRGDVRGSLKLKGEKLTVTGTVRRVGPRIPVHEEHDDAGQHIVEDGFHKALRTDLVMKWMNRTIALDCDNAFFYKLTVTKTDTTE